MVRIRWKSKSNDRMSRTTKRCDGIKCLWFKNRVWCNSAFDTLYRFLFLHVLFGKEAIQNEPKNKKNTHTAHNTNNENFFVSPYFYDVLSLYLNLCLFWILIIAFGSYSFAPSQNKLNKWNWSWFYVRT